MKVTTREEIKETITSTTKKTSVVKVKDLLNLQCSYFANTFSKPINLVNVRALFDKTLQRNQLTLYKWSSEELKDALDMMTSQQLDTKLAKYVSTNGRDEAYTKMKEYQIAITPSATFGERRTYECLLETNPLLVIDFDDTTRKIEDFKQYPWVVGAGESVSRQGCFVLVYIDNPALIKEHFLALRKLFNDADDLKDTTRLRYISYGKSWVRNDSESIVPYTDYIPLPNDEVYDVKQLPATTDYDNETAVNEILSSIGAIEQAGGLHPWTVRIAAKANKKGISLSYAMKEIWSAISKMPIIKDTPRYTKDRFEFDFKAIYNAYREQHHIEVKVRVSRSRISRFNESIYNRSPKVLQELVAVAEQDEEKEVVYFSAIMLMGLLFPNKCFKYFNNTYYPNLYGYIIGDAASFKGKAKIVRTAFKPYQAKIDELFKSRQDAKNKALAHNKQNKDDKQEIPKVPDLNFFFDGNTSSAAMLKAMQDSPLLCMFETEGDTITKTWKTDWGNYSDVLRKAFEHEPLYSLKKSTGEENLQRIHIQNPKLSILVSSTEQQMRKVLSADETENGLMSRFLFYVVQNDKKWYDGWESNSDTDIGKILTDRIKPDIWWTMTNQNDVMYYMSKEAWALHQNYFNQVNDNWPDELFNIISLIRRSGTATARIAVMLEELKNLDKVKKTMSMRTYTVSGSTMALAIDIMKILLQHLFVAWQITYKEHDNKETNVQATDLRQRVSELLGKNPNIGTRAIASELGVKRDKIRDIIGTIDKGKFIVNDNQEHDDEAD